MICKPRIHGGISPYQGARAHIREDMVDEGGSSSLAIVSREFGARFCTLPGPRLRQPYGLSSVSKSIHLEVIHVIYLVHVPGQDHSEIKIIRVRPGYDIFD